MNFGRTSPSRRGTRRQVAKRSLKLEHLEGRSLLAGDVLVTMVQGDIQITGDFDDNDIQLTDLGPGSFYIEGLNGTTINGDPDAYFDGAGVRINMGAGNDTVTILGAGSALPLNLTTDLGNGDNVFSLTGGFEVTGGLRVQAGAGDDQITIDDVRARDMFFSTGSGGETINITNSSTTSAAAGNLSVTSSSAAGASHNLTLGNVQVRKNMDVIWGAGDSNTTIDDTQIITGNLSIRTSTGTASVQIGTATEVAVGGDIYILTGNGAADIDLIGGSGRLVTIKTGAGAADENIAGTQIGKSLLITNGSGGDIINIDEVTVGKDISIVNSSGDHDISIDSGIINGFITITTLGGTQNFDFGANGPVSTGGSMSVKNGVTGEVAFNAINLDIGNTLSVITGRGTHTIIIGGEDGGVSVARGLAVRSDGGASVTMDNVFVGLDLSVTLGNTNGLSEMFIGTNSPLIVARNASFRTGLGDTNITIGAIEIGGNLIVQARQGTNTFIIGGISGIGDLFVGAQTIIASGNGDDTIEIGADPDALSSFTGMFNLNAGNGDDFVTIGEGTTGDAFDNKTFTIDGSFGDDTLTVTNKTAFNPFKPAIRKKLRNFETIDI